MLAGFFFLWGYIKDSAYDNNACNLDERKASISNIVADISPVTLQALSVNMLRHTQLCMQHAGVHFQNFVL
jgi:hypothetical protein